jgi:hypothetical protein
MDSRKPAPIAKIHQLDPDLQKRLSEIHLTSLDEFRAVRKEVQQIQELRWILRRSWQ